MITIPVLMLILSMFCRCKSKQSIVTQQTYITDKQNEKKWDSLFNIRLMKELERYQSLRSHKSEKTLKDITHIKDSTACRFDSDGNKIGEDKYHSETRIISEKDGREIRDSIEHYKEYFDSTMLYKSKYDSLRAIKTSTSMDKQIVEKELTKWQYVCMETGRVFYFFVLIIILIIVYNTLLRKEK